MSETEPPVIRHARDDPGEDASAPTSDAGGRRSGRLVLGLVLAALLVIVAAAGVRAVAQRVGTGSATGGGVVVADQSAVAHQYRDRGVMVIGVNVQDTRAAALAYVREFQVPYQSLFDRSAQVAARLPAVALPTTFILDRDGVIAYQLTGKTTVPILRSRLDGLLARGGRWS